MNLNIPTATAYLTAFTAEKLRDTVTLHSGKTMRYSTALAYVCDLYSSPACTVLRRHLGKLAIEAGKERQMKTAEKKLLDSAFDCITEGKMTEAREILSELIDPDAVEQLTAAISDAADAAVFDVDPAEVKPKKLRTKKAVVVAAVEEFANIVEPEIAKLTKKAKEAKQPRELKVPRELTAKPKDYAAAQEGDDYTSYAARLTAEESELVLGYVGRYEKRGHNLLTHTKTGTRANNSLLARANMAAAAAKRWVGGRDVLLEQMRSSPKRQASQKAVQDERRREAAERKVDKAAAKKLVDASKAEEKAEKAAAKSALAEKPVAKKAARKSVPEQTASV